MNPGDEKTLTIARRSRKNLEFIYKSKQDGHDVEEFTQLLNSMLGMLISLREEHFKGHVVTWKEIEKLGLNRVVIKDYSACSEYPNLKQAKEFSNLITNLRHAFAHNSFELIGDPINAVEVWNIPPDNQGKTSTDKAKRVWQAELTENQLRDIAYLLMNYLDKNNGS